MEILLTDKITAQPVCLVQGESRATTLAFTLPARHSGCALATLAWQVRATNQKTLAFMADTPVRHTAANGCFTLLWQISGHFTCQAGPLLVTLVGSAPDGTAGTAGASQAATPTGTGEDDTSGANGVTPKAAPANGTDDGTDGTAAEAPNSIPASGTDGTAAEAPASLYSAEVTAASAEGVVAKFVVEGIEVAPCPDGDGEPPAQSYFELALLQTGQNAALALESATLAGQSADAAKASDEAAGTSAIAAGASAQQAAQSADAAARSAQGMPPALYDPGGAAQDIFALLNGMPPVYTGHTVAFSAGAGRVTSVAVLGASARAGAAPSPTAPQPITGVRSANLLVSGAETHLLLCKNFTGAESFTTWGTANTTTEFASDPLDVYTLPTGDTLPAALCSHFAAPLTPNQLWSAAAPGFSASYRVLLRTAHKTVAELKAWLAAQHAAGTPLQVVYRRTTPLVEQKPAAAPALPEGQNHLAAADENARVQVTLKRVFEA